MAEIETTRSLQLQFDKRGGLLPVIVQEWQSREVLMLGYANEAAFLHTLDTGYATFWSTSRQALWTKGLTSGDRLRLREIKVDCDQDALIYLVEMEGKGACHTRDKAGNTRRSCFYRKVVLDNKSHPPQLSMEE